MYSQESKKRKTDTGTSLEDCGEPAGYGVTVQGYGLLSDVIIDGEGVLEPLYKVWAVLLTRMLTTGMFCSAVTITCTSDASL